jgi:ribosomal protein S18 acetylase RimI-like enzyme
MTQNSPGQSHEITFREVKTKQDFIATSGLARIIWTEHYTPIIGSEQVTYMLEKSQSTSAIKEQISKGMKYFLVMKEDMAVGYTGFEFRENELFLSKLYILSFERGQKIGKKTLGFIRHSALNAGMHRITLTVNKNNSTAISAYLKLGYQILKPIVQDIGQGFVMDDYLMSKELKSKD